MTFTIHDAGSQLTAQLEGRLDASTVNQFQEELQPLLNATASSITIDCGGLEYISSQGLRLFLVLQKSVNARNANLVLTNMQATVKEVFDITGFSSIIKIQ